MFASTSARLNMLLLVLLVVMATAIIGILATRAGAGSLDPPAAPASTMHTLGDTPPSWDQVLNSTNGAPGPTNPPAGCNSDRFKCVMTYSQCGGVCITVYPAVLDEETGLVWQRSPSTRRTTWAGALGLCAELMIENRGGWRLPSIAELTSLGAGVGGSLPAASPFTNVDMSGSYWSSTEDDTTTPTVAFAAGFGDFGSSAKSSSEDVWCVRGAV